MDQETDLAQRILDTALKLAEQRSWEAMRLYEVAEELDLTLAEIREHYRQKDDLAEAWFDRADRAMLIDAAAAEYSLLTGRERIHRSIMAWLNVLAAHRSITAEMLRYKLEIGHIHLQALGIMRISRTVQWILQAARREASNIRRIVEEITVTSIYLATFALWLQDDSPDFERTSQLLDKLLRKAAICSHFLPAPRQTHEMYEGHRSSSFLNSE